jgi:hypothetical protein
LLRVSLLTFFDLKMGGSAKQSTALEKEEKL